MAPTNDRPKWIDDLVRALGTEIGIEDLDLGDDGVFELDFQGTVIAVFFVPPSASSGEALLLKSALDLPRQLPGAALALLLTANLGGFTEGKGMIACDLAFGLWVWTDRIDLAGLTPTQFRLRLEQAANAARDWGLALPNLIAKADGAPTDRATDPESDAASVLIRL